MRNYWQPNIDNWILNENDADAFSSSPNSKYGGDYMAGGSKFPLPVKSEEEEEKHDKLKQSYKGITTLSRLKEQINQVLEDICNLSKTDHNDYKSKNNPYEVIIQMIDNPDLKTMLNIASDEIKQRNLNSF